MSRDPGYVPAHYSPTDLRHPSDVAIRIRQKGYSTFPADVSDDVSDDNVPGDLRDDDDNNATLDTVCRRVLVSPDS